MSTATIPYELLAALERERAERERPIDNYRDLQDELLRILLFAAVGQQQATSEDTRMSEALHRFQNDAIFRHSIKYQLSEIVRVLDRYRPR